MHKDGKAASWEKWLAEQDEGDVSDHAKEIGAQKRALAKKALEELLQAEPRLEGDDPWLRYLDET